MTSCQVNPPVGAVSSCAQVQSCTTDIAGYMLNQFTNMRTVTTLGIIADGHPLLGPYDASGSLVSGTDLCNGKSDSNGNYNYWAKTKYPYIVYVNHALADEGSIP